jgi:CyaY protein
MARQGGAGHGRGAGVAAPVPVLVDGADAAGLGLKVCGKVARPAAASPVGRKSVPFCPQPARAATPTAARTRRKACAPTRILKTPPTRQIVMTDLEFMDRAEALLARIEACCDRINDESDVDIDNQRVGGMITLTLRNGSQIIVNLQKPLHEVWMAAKAGGFHYKHDGACWMDTKGNGEFFAHLSRYASEQAGRPLEFS